MFEEVSTLLIAVAIAGALLAVGAAVLVYFNPQQPVDHANALAYPLVRPLNGTHVQLGVQPLADYVEVEEVAWSRGGTQGRAAIRAVAKNATWLPVSVPCGANVTMATRYGSASRALSFHVACLQREPVPRTDLTTLYQLLVSYASYVADYVVYRSVPVLTAYFSHGRFDYYGFGSLSIGSQNVGPFPYVAVPGNLSGVGPWPPPSFAAIALKPNVTAKVYEIGVVQPPHPPFRNCTLFKIDEPPPYNYDAECTVMHRWLSLYVFWNDTLEIWINNVRIYNGTPPESPAEYDAPQGFKVYFNPDNRTLAIRYESRTYRCRIDDWYCSNIPRKIWRTALSVRLNSSVSHWSGWVKMINVPTPAEEVERVEGWNVMPAGPYVGLAENVTLLRSPVDILGVVPPLEAYSVYAFYNGSGLVVRWGDPHCGLAERCIRTKFYPQPGVYRIDVARFSAGLIVYADDFYAVAITSTYRGVCNTESREYCATVGWYAPGVKKLNTNYGWVQVATGEYICYVRSTGYCNEVPFNEGRFSIECKKDDGSSRGAVELVFHGNLTVSVYKDGQFLYRVRPYVCTWACRPLSGPWPPASVMTAVVRWGPSGIEIITAPFATTPGPERFKMGYGMLHVTRGVLDEPLAHLTAWRYNLTGAYPYRLEVKINATPYEVSRKYDIYRGVYQIILNVTYAGYLKLHLDNKTVAYDAFYGWGLMYVEVEPEPVYYDYGDPVEYVFGGGGGGGGESTHVTVTPVGQRHRNRKKWGNGYYVEIYNVYVVRECRGDTCVTYEKEVKVGAYTVGGTSYHVYDSQNDKTCGYEAAQDSGGVVTCG